MPVNNSALLSAASPALSLSLTHQRFCLPVSHRPLCPGPSRACVPTSQEHPASSRQPWGRTKQGKDGDVGDVETGKETYVRACVCVFVMIPSTLPDTLQICFLREQNVTKTSDGHFTET